MTIPKSRRSRMATLRFQLEHYETLEASASAEGISFSELIRRMTCEHPDRPYQANPSPPQSSLDGDQFAAELRALEIRVETLATFVDRMSRDFAVQLEIRSTQHASAIREHASALRAHALAIERLIEAFRRRTSEPRSTTSSRSMDTSAAVRDAECHERTATSSTTGPTARRIRRATRA